MEIIRRYMERENVYNYYLDDGKKVFEIFFAGNLDLYWNLRIKKDQEVSREEWIAEVKDTFIIDKENYFIYTLFEQLYEEIKNAKVYESISKNDYKQRYCYPFLYDGNKIEWHSDEEEYKVADRFIIKKNEDNFEIEFIKPELTDEKFQFRIPSCVTVRLRNSGSFYDPFNIIFMRMFHKLQEYNPDYHQIHFEEIAYAKKRSLKKNINKGE